MTALAKVRYRRLAALRERRSSVTFDTFTDVSHRQAAPAKLELTTRVKGSELTARRAAACSAGCQETGLSSTREASRPSPSSSPTIGGPRRPHHAVEQGGTKRTWQGRWNDGRQDRSNPVILSHAILSTESGATGKRSRRESKFDSPTRAVHFEDGAKSSSSNPQRGVGT